MDAQNLANAQQPGQPNPENIPNEVRIQTAMANYGQVPTDVQMQTAMSNDAALGLPPWYANMRWKEFYTNPEVGYKQLYADDANTGVDPEYVFYQRRNRMYLDGHIYYAHGNEQTAAKLLDAFKTTKREQMVDSDSDILNAIEGIASVKFEWYQPNPQAVRQHAGYFPFINKSDI
ncbi:hypothetical protein TVAGG3_1032230, partial [Trichomonas vaginalis G3]|uniref:hypothetical protein n=1 Tax=Trichomonas vaginalis (strain ATCC PRA-98 / G3) TaxID=412133 RepID=UPI0021E580EC